MVVYSRETNTIFNSRMKLDFLQRRFHRTAAITCAICIATIAAMTKGTFAVFIMNKSACQSHLRNKKYNTTIENSSFAIVFQILFFGGCFSNLSPVADGLRSNSLSADLINLSTCFQRNTVFWPSFIGARRVATMYGLAFAGSVLCWRDGLYLFPYGV